MVASDSSNRRSRRRVLVGSAGLFGAATLGIGGRTIALATWEPRPPTMAGRVFVETSSGPDLRSLTATVRAYESSWAAEQAAHDLFSKATAPITNMEASLSEVYRQPLDDPYGIDGRWTIIAGAAGVASYHRGLFFAVKQMCWTLDAGKLQEPDDHAFLVPLAGVLRDRFNALGSSGEVDLWSLLPDVDDLGGEFRLVQSFDHEDEQPS